MHSRNLLQLIAPQQICLKVAVEINLKPFAAGSIVTIETTDAQALIKQGKASATRQGERLLSVNAFTTSALVFTEEPTLDSQEPVEEVPTVNAAPDVRTR